MCYNLNFRSKGPNRLERNIHHIIVYLYRQLFSNDIGHIVCRISVGEGSQQSKRVATNCQIVCQFSHSLVLAYTPVCKMNRIIYFIITMLVYNVVSRHLTVKEEVVIPRDMSKYVLVQSAFDDSPVRNENCPEGYQLDVSGTCREVWFEEWDYNSR